ncbi:hypothetical protein skT53_09970 [Effusibacillus dendaii]|uniref:Competence protein ComFB n=1 Tax=Effusibacillus dendaii TaxID=2743772 RepID=A0A7I8D9H3_9BACL|nr:hypothetical protein skT53_09970 [Effusibacillus dendaii]
MFLVNATEMIVQDLLELFLSNHALKCSCPHCKQTGETYIKTLYMNTQLQLDVIKEIAKSATIVEKIQIIIKGKI